MIGGSVLDVLIPTCNRPCGLAVTLTALSAQSFLDFQIIVSDQSDGQSVFDEPEVAAVLRFLQASGRQVQTVRHLPRRGMAEQRDFLLSKVSAPYCLFLDDDVLLESDVIERLHRVITEQRCGFVGSALHGSQQWARHHLHSAANLFHVQTRLGLSRETTRLYRVAWIGGCVLFDTQKLRDVGGFDFWTALPGEHWGKTCWCNCVSWSALAVAA